MKHLKLIFGLAVILFAAVGAYATAKNTNLEPVWVEHNDGCIEVQAEPCPDTGQLGCLQLVEIPGEGSQLKQLYETKHPTLDECLNPYYTE